MLLSLNFVTFRMIYNQLCSLHCLTSKGFNGNTGCYSYKFIHWFNMCLSNSLPSILYCDSCCDSVKSFLWYKNLNLDAKSFPILRLTTLITTQSHANGIISYMKREHETDYKKMIQKYTNVIFFYQCLLILIFHNETKESFTFLMSCKEFIEHQIDHHVEKSDIVSRYATVQNM